MKKIFLTLTLVAGFMATAQVKIGGTVLTQTVIDANSLLELESTTQGLLYPRVPLQSTTSYAPLNDTYPNVKQAGMTVYNTAITTTGTNDVTPGLYVNDGFNWIRVTPTAPKTLYTDNAAITSARTVTLNNNDLTFTAGVGGTGKTVVASAFKTTGSVYTKYRVATSLGLVQADDYIIDFQISGAIAAFSGVLPDPTTIPAGRVIILRNSSSRGGTGGTYSITAPDSGYIIAAASNIANNLSMMLYCDGAKWIRICE